MFLLLSHQLSWRTEDSKAIRGFAWEQQYLNMFVDSDNINVGNGDVLTRIYAPSSANQDQAHALPHRAYRQRQPERTATGEEVAPPFLDQGHNCELYVETAPTHAVLYRKSSPPPPMTFARWSLYDGIRPYYKLSLCNYWIFPLSRRIPAMFSCLDIALNCCLFLLL